MTKLTVGNRDLSKESSEKGFLGNSIRADD